MALYKLDGGHILLVGEGDFSFSVAFIQEVKPDVKVISSCLLSSKKLHQVHLSAEKNIAFLQQKGVEVIYEVDATKLQENEYLAGRTFQRIIFNFPHVGGKSNIKKNRALVKDFFGSAVTKLAYDGTICVTFCQGQGGTPSDQPVRAWNDSWQSVAAGTYHNLVLQEIWPFDIKQYPQYKSTGYRSCDKQFHTNGALTYVFSKRLSLPDAAIPPKLSQITVDGKCYWTDSCYIASHGIRCLCKEKHHPVQLVTSGLLDAVSKVSALSVNLLDEDSPLVQLAGNVKQTYQLIPVTANCEDSLSETNRGSCCINQIFNHAGFEKTEVCMDGRELPDGDKSSAISDIPSEEGSFAYRLCSTSGCTSNQQGVDSLYLRRTLLDSTPKEARPGCLWCHYGSVYRRRKLVHCCDLPMKSEFLLMLDASTEAGSLSLMKEIIYGALSSLLTEQHQVVIELNTDEPEDWLTAHLMKDSLQGVMVYYKSFDQSATVACNQVSDTGKPTIPDIKAVKRVKLSGCAGYIGLTHDSKAVGILDLDRVTQIRYGLPDTRLLWCQDVAVLDQFRELSPADSWCFKPVSLYPPLWRHDVSFWEATQGAFSEQLLVDLIRDVGGDALKCVRLMNVWRDPATGRTSRCYRQIYQSYTQAVSHDFAHKLQNAVRQTLMLRMGVDLR